MSYSWRNSETENTQSHYLKFPIKLSRLEHKVLRELDDDPSSGRAFITMMDDRKRTEVGAACKRLDRRGLIACTGGHYRAEQVEEAYALTRLGWCALHKGGAFRSYALAMRDLLHTLDGGTTLVPDTKWLLCKRWLSEPRTEDGEPKYADRRAWICEWLEERGLVSAKSTVDWGVIRSVECGHRRGRRRKDYPGQITYTRSDNGERLLGWLEQRYADAPDLSAWYFSHNEGAKTPGLPRHREGLSAPDIRPWPERSSL